MQPESLPWPVSLVSENPRRRDESARAELLALKVTGLRDRARACGASPDACTAALDSERPKESLADLILMMERTGGVQAADPAAAAGRTQLGSTAEAMAELQAVLEHSVDVLDLLCARAPRSRRASVVRLLDRVEAALASTINAPANNHDGVSRRATFLAASPHDDGQTVSST